MSARACVCVCVCVDSLRMIPSNHSCPQLSLTQQQIYLVLTAVWGLYERNNIEPSAGGRLRAKLLTGFCVSITAMLVMTDKESIIHIAGKTFLILAFSASFIYVFYAGSIGK